MHIYIRTAVAGAKYWQYEPLPIHRGLLLAGPLTNMMTRARVRSETGNPGIIIFDALHKKVSRRTEYHYFRRLTQESK